MKARVLIIGGAAGCGLMIALCVGGLFVLGTLMEAGSIPDSRAVRGHELSASHLSFLQENGLLDPGETITLYYSTSLISHRAQGNYFTPTHVVSYSTIDGQVSSVRATWPEVSSVTPRLATEWYEDTVVTVGTARYGSFDLWVSTEGGMDDRFIQELLAAWNEGRGW